MKPLPLTADRIATLQSFANQGAAGRVGYYQALQSWGYDYGGLALSVVQNSGAAGRIANNYASDIIERFAGQKPTEAELVRYSVDLMLRDLRARREDIRLGGTGDIGGVVIDRYHSDSLTFFGWPPEAFTPNILLRLAHNDIERESIWKSLLSVRPDDAEGQGAINYGASLLNVQNTLQGLG